MSTSDSDYSIDWLASDEDDYDYDGPERLSPRGAEEPPAPSSSKESPPSCPRSGSTQRRRTTTTARRKRARNGCSDRKEGGAAASPATSPAASPAASPEAPAVSPVRGLTSVCSRQPPPVEPGRRPTRKRAHGAGSDGICEKPQPDAENELFYNKCTELRCYVQPLSSILHGLRSGRYSQRLSSFQESVAMDRIQRILGVLQNPDVGGSFLRIILKIEEMLRSWFPHIKPNRLRTDDCPPAKKQKQHHGSASPPPPSPASPRPSDVGPAAPYSPAHLKRSHAPPACPPKAPGSAPGRAPPLTQDNAVSSSTDSHAGPPGRLRAGAGPRPSPSRGPLPFKISSPCLERLLQAKDSIIGPRTTGGGAWSS